MSHDESKTAEQAVESTAVWTPRRTKLAGFAGIIGGLGGLLGSFGGLGVAGLSIGGTGIDPSAVSMLHPVWYALFAVALLAANARYGSGYSRGERSVALVLVLSLVSYAGSIVVLVVGRPLLGDLFLPIGVLTGAAYLVIRLLGSLYGIGLWRHGDVSRLTAGLFLVLFPAIFVLGPLTLLGFPAVLIGAPLDLAFVALGYELQTTEMKSSAESAAVRG